MIEDVIIGASFTGKTVINIVASLDGPFGFSGFVTLYFILSVPK